MTPAAVYQWWTPLEVFFITKNYTTQQRAIQSEVQLLLVFVEQRAIDIIVLVRDHSAIEVGLRYAVRKEINSPTT